MVPPERISRFLTYLLRHRPKEYPIAFDAHGFVPWDDAVRTVRERFPDSTEDEIRGVVEGSEKQRFLQNGLKPRDRQYVHLSRSLDGAIEGGKRRDPFPAIIVVDAQRAHAEGSYLFSSGPLFLTEVVPPRFLPIRRS